MKRSGQVHQETLDMYTDELKEKRVADEKLTENSEEERVRTAGKMTYLPVVPNLSPALAQAIGLFEVDGMTILLQVEGQEDEWLIARQDHISRLRRYRWATSQRPGKT